MYNLIHLSSPSMLSLDLSVAYLMKKKYPLKSNVNDFFENNLTTDITRFQKYNLQGIC